MAAIPATNKIEITKPDAWTVVVLLNDTEHLRARLNTKNTQFKIGDTKHNARQWVGFTAPNTIMSLAERQAYGAAITVKTTAGCDNENLECHKENDDGTFTFTAFEKIEENITIIHDNETYLVTKVEEETVLPDPDFRITAVKSTERSPLVKAARA